MTATTTMAPAAAEPDATPLRKRRPIAMWLGVGWLALVCFLAIFADFLPFVRTYDQRVRGAGPYKFGPGNDFWFGSDQLGRDVFARCVYGAQTSLRVAVVSIIVGLAIGGTLGVIAGYFKGKTDRVLSIVFDTLLAFPVLVIAILIIGRLDVLSSENESFEWLTRSWSVTMVLGLLSIAPVARIVRAQTLSISQREYVLAARSLGAGKRRIIWREVVPNLVPAMMSVVFTGIAVLLVAEGGLAFLGYSVKLPSPTWGLLVSENRQKIEDAWWATIFPCIMFFATVLSFNVIGDHVARRFDIREAAI
jgi:peptide/nickel transport system permease protein